MHEGEKCPQAVLLNFGNAPYPRAKAATIDTAGSDTANIVMTFVSFQLK